MKNHITFFLLMATAFTVGPALAWEAVKVSSVEHSTF